jgi:hypothetical protein
MYAGQYAWISLFVVVLFLFRKIYGEVVEQSLLMVGYNVLLNTSSKKLASVAATLTVLSLYGDRSNLSI